MTDRDFLRIRLSGPNYHLLTDLSSIDTHVPGDYPIQFLVNGETQVCLLSVRDTIAPFATVCDKTIPIGYELEAYDFITELDDGSAVTACLFSSEEKENGQIFPSKLLAGTYALVLSLTDLGGNETRYPVRLTVCNVSPSCQVELGSETFDVSHYRTGKASSGSSPISLSYQTDIEPLLSQAGSHTIELVADGIIVPVELVVTDTTPPIIKKKKVSLWVGDTAKPKDFTKKITDASNVTVRFITKPDYSQLGTQTIQLSAADSFGNETIFKAKLTIREDTEGPMLLGIRELSFPLGVTITYRKSVYAMDERDGEVVLQVDSSQVNPGQLGRYPVTYFAVDSLGNETRQTTYINIIEALAITEEELNELADEVLNELQIFDLSEYEALWAIYNWCQNTIHYSGSSDKSSSLKAAYDGFQTHSGDCYTYYALADTLLTRAGFESMEIDRSGTNTFHSWNLVRYQEKWYHFDACPLLAGESFVPFLVCDKDLLAFSKEYGKRHPDESHQNYYQFDSHSYPKRGETSIYEP